MRLRKQIHLTILLIIALALTAGTPIRSFATDGTGLWPSFSMPQTGARFSFSTTQTGGQSSFGIPQSGLRSSFSIPQSSLRSFSVPQTSSQADFNRIYDSLPGLSSYRDVSRYRTGVPNSGSVFSFSTTQTGSQVYFNRIYNTLPGLSSYRAEPQYRTSMSDISRLTVSDCTVGPTKDESFPPGANPIYYNSNIIRYNTQLKEWSAKNNVRVIDLYSFIRSESSILYDRDGVHYLPTPNPVLWKYIISRL